MTAHAGEIDVKNRILSTATAAALALTAAACGDATGPEGTTAIAFRTASGAASASVGPGDISLSHSSNPDAPTLDVDGTNGQLSIASVHFILAEFELERADEAEDCDDDAAPEEACEEFEAPMGFLELPLTGEDAVAVQQPVAAGSYDELEFEIEDLEEDEDGEDGAEIQQLLTEVRERFPGWPEKGSLRVHGTFTPKDDQGSLLADQARDFTVYFGAEVEVEKEFETPVEITEQNNAMTVSVDPRMWFEVGDGTVVDLSQYDFDQDAGQPVPEFEVEAENGLSEAFLSVEHGG